MHRHRLHLHASPVCLGVASFEQAHCGAPIRLRRRRDSRQRDDVALCRRSASGIAELAITGRRRCEPALQGRDVDAAVRGCDSVRRTDAQRCDDARLNLGR